MPHAFHEMPIMTVPIQGLTHIPCNFAQIIVEQTAVHKKSVPSRTYSISWIWLTAPPTMANIVDPWPVCTIYCPWVERLWLLTIRWYDIDWHSCVFPIWWKNIHWQGRGNRDDWGMIQHTCYHSEILITYRASCLWSSSWTRVVP